jgi:outer membrane receptor protein involved in Fe transport
MKTNQHTKLNRENKAPPFQITPIHAALLGIGLLACSPSYADDETQLKAENTRLQQEIERLRQALEQKQPAVNQAATEAKPSNNQPEVEKTEEKEEEHSLLNEVLVRAKKRSEVEKVKEIPKSISAVSGSELDKYSATNVTDILKRVGNASWSYGNPRTGGYTMRGLSAGSSDAIDPSVGVVVDGISYAYSPLAAGTDFFDLESVNVTRGPQGTAGHKNTSLGEIVFTTKKPTFNSEADASVLWGQNNTVKTQAVIGGPVIDKTLAWRASFQRNTADGNYTNAYNDNPGRQTYVNTDRTFARTQFLYTPNDDFKALVSLHYQPKGTENLNGLTFKSVQPFTYKNGAAIDHSSLPDQVLQRQWFTNTIPNAKDNYYNFPVYTDNNGGIMTGTRGANVNLDWNIWGGHKLSYIGGYKDHYFTAANDEGTPFNITTDGGYITNYLQYSQELVLESEKGGFAEYKAGVYSFHSDNNSNSRTRYGTDAGAWFANASQYNALYASTQGQALLKDALNGVYKNTLTTVENQSNAVFGEVKWHLTDPLTLTTGLRVSDEDRRSTGGILIADQGAGAGLNPSAINDVQLGGFNSNSSGALLTNTAGQLALADQVANRYFATNYAGLNATQKTQIANAKALRNGQFGTLYQVANAQPYQGVLYNGNVALNYKINESYTPYVAWQHGSKAGVSQIAGATKIGGTSMLVKPEISDNYEIGLKSSFFDKTLDVNLDFFFDDIKDFQQSVYYIDPIATALSATPNVPVYKSGTGNVANVVVKGIELDTNYKFNDNLAFRFAGAYNDARYQDYQFAAKPVEQGNEAVKYFDASGRTLPRAPKFTGNLAVDYSQPVFGSFVFHTNINENYAGKSNYDLSLSDYGWINAHWNTDLSIGIGRKDRLFDANLIVRNLFNQNFPTTMSWTGYAPSNERWIGVQFSSKI